MAGNKIDKVTDGFIEWCARDTASARFQRSVVQGVIGVGCGILAAIAADNAIVGTYVAPTVMAVLAPAMKAIGNKGEVDDAK